MCKKAGFKYATIEAVNPFTTKAATWNNFTSVHVEKAATYPLWKWKGETLDMSEHEGECEFFVKNLEELQVDGDNKEENEQNETADMENKQMEE